MATDLSTAVRGKGVRPTRVTRPSCVCVCALCVCVCVLCACVVVPSPHQQRLDHPPSSFFFGGRHSSLQPYG